MGVTFFSGRSPEAKKKATDRSTASNAPKAAPPLSSAKTAVAAVSSVLTQAQRAVTPIAAVSKKFIHLVNSEIGSKARWLK